MAQSVRQRPTKSLFALFGAIGLIVSARSLAACGATLAFGCKAAAGSCRALLGAAADVGHDRAYRSRVAMRGRSLLADLTSEKRPFLTYEENRPAKKRRLSRKERKQRAEDAPPVPPPTPSDDQLELMQQLRKTNNVEGLFEFLEIALRAPAFAAKHAALAMDLLAIRKPSLRPDDLDALTVDPAVVLLANRGPDLFENSEALVPGLSISALRCIATYIEFVPQLGNMIKPLARHVVDRVDEVKPEKLAELIWAIAELRDVAPELQNTVLPHFVDTDPRHRRIIGLKGTMSPHLISQVRKALFKLRKDVPELREVLRVPERSSNTFSGIG